MVPADKGLHYLRVKGFTALLLIPSVRHQFHTCRLQTSCFSLLHNSPQTSSGTEGVSVHDIWHCGAVAGLSSLSCTAILCFLEGCRMQPVLVWFCLSLRNDLSFLVVCRQLWLPLELCAL